MSSAEPTEPTVFTRIINGEIPGRFVWADDVCVAFATIEPQTRGHVLVVPREEIASYVDAPEETVAHLAVVAQRIAAAQVRVFDAVRPGIIVVGLDVPHLHVHVLPLYDASDVNPSSASAVPADDLDAAMTELRTALAEDGWGANVPSELGSPALA